MSNEITWAFAHPIQRSEATAEGPLDRISLRDHIVEVEIGAFQQERGLTQRICFNVVVEVRPHDNDLGDDVDRIPAILKERHAALHMYGKAEARPGRKMGHVNRVVAKV